MTPEQFRSLKPGDIIRWKRKDGTYVLRTVIDIGKSGSIRLPIMRRSWTRRIHTVYGEYETCIRADLHDRREPDRLMTDPELMRLCDIGFNVPEQLKRERSEYGCLQAVPSHKMSGAATVARTFCKP